MIRLVLLRRVMRWGRLGLLVSLILWMGISVVAERVMLHPRRWDVGAPPSQRGWVYQDVAFKTSDGITLHGWWIPGALHQTVVMVHGWTSSRREPYDKSAYLHAAGYNILVFDLRGHGQSGGTMTTMGYREPQDVEAAVAFAKSEDSGPIALFGYSMGAATAIEAGARDAQVTAVVEDSGYASLLDVVQADFRQSTGLPLSPLASVFLALGQADIGVPIGRVEPLNDAIGLTKPLLAIVGTSDRTVPPSEGFRLFAAAAGPKQLLVVPGAGHTQAYYKDPQVYQQTVLDFLRQALGSQAR